MAVHRINFFEQNCEKIAVGVAAAGLLGVIAWQFVDTTVVSVGARKETPIGEVYQTLETQANAVKADLQSRSPILPTVKGSSVVEDHKKLQEKDVALSLIDWRTLPVPTKIGAGVAVDGGARADGTYIRIPDLAKPTKPIAASFVTTIDPAEAVAAPDLAKYIPAVAPHDKAAVSVEATFDGTLWRAEFEKGNAKGQGKDDLRPLARSWWAQIEVLKVEMLRQELKPDGTWGEVKVVVSMPGRLDLTKDLGAANLEEAAKTAFSNRDGVLRPEFYRRAMIDTNMVGDEWVPPTELAGADAADQEKQKLKNDLRKLEQDIARREAAIAEKKKVPATNPGGNRPPGGGLGGPGGRNPGGGPGTAPVKEDPQIKRMEEQLNAKKLEADELRKQLESGGAKVKRPVVVPPIDRDLSPILLDKEVRIWAHDIDAQRGVTYRYQMRLAIVNPLFARGGELRPEDQPKARDAMMYTQVSDWSEPVTVDPEVLYFITTAQGKGGLNTISTAKAEMYKFTWGYWRKGSVSMEPGDGLAARLSVPDSEKIIAEHAPAEQPNNPPGAPAAPPGGRQPVAPGGGLGPAPERPLPAPGGGAPKPGDKDKPAGTLPTKDEVVSVDAFLLDITTPPEVVTGLGGAASASAQVFMREPDGRIVVRIPERQKNDEIYKRIARSADKGELQIKGLLDDQGKAADKPKDPPRFPQPPINPPPGPGGGGGGGGSGGG